MRLIIRDLIYRSPLLSFGPERIARPVYCYPSYASIPRSASNHHVSCLSGFFFQTLSASSTHFSCLSRFGCHTCSSHSPASRSEAIDVITKSGYRLFHARNYFFTKFQKNIKVGSINSIFYFLHKAAEPFNCLEQDNLTQS